MTDKISDEAMDGLIQGILNTIIITNEGKIELRGASRILTIRHDINILNSVLQEKTDFFRKLKKKRYLLSSESDWTYGSEFIDIFKKLKTDNKTSFKDFEEEFSKKLAEIAKIKPKEFTLIYPLNLKFVEKIESEILGDKFEITSFKDFASKFLDVERIIQEAKESKDIETEYKFRTLLGIRNEEFSYFVIKVYARNDDFAIEYATERLLRVLGLLAFAKYKGDQPITIGGRATKLSKLSLSKVLIFDRDGFINFGNFNGEIKSLEEMNDENLDIFSQFLKSFNNIVSQDIIRILENTLTSYYEALIDEDIAYSFLKYWICVELCLLKSERITENEIIKRLKSMLISADPNLKFRIDNLYARRNNLVHNLNMNVSQIDRNLVKIISELLIYFLFDNSNKFQNKNELNLFYKFIQEDENSLETDKRVIDLIMEFRKNIEKDKQ